MDFSNCQFLGGWLTSTDVINNFQLNGTEEKFFLAFKDYNLTTNYSGIIVYKEYGVYAVSFRDINYAYDTQSPLLQNYMDKQSLILWIKSLDGDYYDLFGALTTEQKETLYLTLENDE